MQIDLKFVDLHLNLI